MRLFLRKSLKPNPLNPSQFEKMSGEKWAIFAIHTNPKNLHFSSYFFNLPGFRGCGLEALYQKQPHLQPNGIPKTVKVRASREGRDLLAKELALLKRKDPIRNGKKFIIILSPLAKDLRQEKQNKSKKKMLNFRLFSPIFYLYFIEIIESPCWVNN